MWIYYRLSRWLSGKESASQSRRHRLDPWVRKIPWSRKWQPTPVFLPGKFHGQRSLVDYRLWDYKESGMTDRLSTAWFRTFEYFLQMIHVSPCVLLFKTLFWKKHSMLRWGITSKENADASLREPFDSSKSDWKSSSRRKCLKKKTTTKTLSVLTVEELGEQKKEWEKQDPQNGRNIHQ